MLSHHRKFFPKLWTDSLFNGLAIFSLSGSSLLAAEPAAQATRIIPISFTCSPTDCVPSGSLPAYSEGINFDESPSVTLPPSSFSDANVYDYSAELTGGTLLASHHVPAMMGDFFGTGSMDMCQYLSGFNSALGTVAKVASPTAGSGVGRQKLAENTSPIPNDRFFINYNYFHNVDIDTGGMDVNRITPGFEKTFFDRMMSFEARFPVANTQNSSLRFQGTGPAPLQTGELISSDNMEFGNITLFLKAALFRTENSLFTAGLGISLPTADDTIIRDADTNVVLNHVKNQSVHLLPFIGGAYVPNDRFFMQWMMQIDVDTNGQDVTANTPGFDGWADVGNGLEWVSLPAESAHAHFKDKTFMYIDVGVGYWLYRNNNAPFITGFAPSFETHINQSLGGPNNINLHGFSSSPDSMIVPWNVNTPRNITQVNLVFAATTEIRRNLQIQTGYALPVTGGAGKQFDGEFRLMANWYFGSPMTPTREFLPQF